MTYKHTQIGYLIIIVLLAVGALFGFILVMTGFDLIVFALISIILLILASFASLQVTIDGRYLRLQFGYGIFKKRFSLSEIASSEAARNHWYYGWGIRFWFWPHMWIYNVSGLDAVEIKLINGRRYRIGTDQPKRLELAIKEAIK